MKVVLILLAIVAIATHVKGDGVNKVVKTALQEVYPLLMGADAATEAAATGVETLAKTAGSIAKKATNAVAVLGGDALQGVGATVGAVPAGLFHLVKLLQRGLLGKVLKAVLGGSSSTSSSSSHRNHRKNKRVRGGRGRQHGGGGRKNRKDHGAVHSSSSKKLVVVHTGGSSSHNSDSNSNNRMGGNRRRGNGNNRGYSRGNARMNMGHH